MDAIYSTSGIQGDDTAAVPGAAGCGAFGILDSAVDSKVDLPAAWGSSTVTLNDASAYFAGLASPASVFPDDGADLAQYWESAE
jgi:hypothetical protein